VDADQPQRRPSTPLVVGLLLCVVAIAFEQIAVVTAMPAAEADLGDLDLYAWAFTAFVIAQIVAIVAAGRASDKIGPKVPLVVGFVVFAAGLLVAGSAPSMAVLLVGRFIQGLGGGTMNLAVMVLVARLFNGRQRAVMMTWMSMAWMLPAFIGPPIAGLLSTQWSWHWVFYSVLPLMAVGGLLILVPLLRADLSPEPVASTPRRGLPVLLAAPLVALGVAAIQVAGQRLEIGSLPWLIGGVVLLVLGLPTLLPRGYRVLGVGLAANVNTRLLITGAFFGAETFMTLMLTRAEGLELTIAGLALTVGSAGWAVGSWLQSRPWLMLRRDQIVSVGGVATAAGLAMVAVAAWFPGHLLWAVVLGWVIGGLGMGLQMSSTNLVVMELSAPVELGANTSSLQVGEALGSSVVAGLAGTIFATASAADAALLSGAVFGPIYTAMALVAVLGLLASLRIGPVVNHSIDNISTSR
jgi:MFS family permease